MMYRYQYKPLTKPTSIRIIALEPSLDDDAPLRCNLIHQDREDLLYGRGQIPHYDSVSYVWGNNLPLQYELLEQGQVLPISAHVEEILRNIRKTTKIRYLWIDSVCLNQSDIDEKAQQIPFMGQIFIQSRKTHIYLNSLTTLHDAMIILLRLSRHKPPVLFKSAMSESQDDPLSQSDQAFDDQAIAQFFEHPWFTRRFVLQEAALGQNPTFRHDKHALSWDSLQRAIVVVQASSCAAVEHSEAALTAIAMVRDLRGRTLPISRLLIRYHKSRCLKEVDRIYSLYGLADHAPLHNLPKPDYSIPYTIAYAHMARWLRATDAIRAVVPFGQQQDDLLDSLLSFGGLWHFDERLPSWVPAWSQNVLSAVHGQRDDLPAEDISMPMQLHAFPCRAYLKCQIKWASALTPINDFDGILAIFNVVEDMINKKAHHYRFTKWTQVCELIGALSFAAKSRSRHNGALRHLRHLNAFLTQVQTEIGSYDARQITEAETRAKYQQILHKAFQVSQDVITAWNESLKNSAISMRQDDEVLERLFVVPTCSKTDDFCAVLQTPNGQDDAYDRLVVLRPNAPSQHLSRAFVIDEEQAVGPDMEIRTPCFRFIGAAYSARKFELRRGKGFEDI